MKIALYDGSEITVTKDYAQKVAEYAGLIEIPTPSGPVYVNAKNIASITTGGDPTVLQKLLEAEPKNTNNP